MLEVLSVEPGEGLPIGVRGLFSVPVVEFVGCSEGMPLGNGFPFPRIILCRRFQGRLAIGIVGVGLGIGVDLVKSGVKLGFGVVCALGLGCETDFLTDGLGFFEETTSFRFRMLVSES
ncbi:DNA processing protein DprA [Nostoc cycadae WK-1]|uniref:DNA processing protein DprA n=1 Tax=Nostoc cycadae WK-1 TaxID=1861711 RepID=A0A2H6LLG3_9NOSO|nr:DNA processing protein DprA [Nostoc cycadae WK-1]